MFLRPSCAVLPLGPFGKLAAGALQPLLLLIELGCLAAAHAAYLKIRRVLRLSRKPSAIALPALSRDLCSAEPLSCLG